MYFITICCKPRGTNQLCHESPAKTVFETARCYHATERCYVYLLLLMPDHLHGLIGIPGDVELSNLIRNFKRITARILKIKWQANFFDHRLRQDESLAAKGAYIRANPVRAGLVGSENEWPYFREFADFEGQSHQRAGD